MKQKQKEGSSWNGENNNKLTFPVFRHANENKNLR